MKAPRWIPLLILIGTIVADQATKAAARTTLRDEPRLSFMHDTLRLHYVENEGGFLGLGRGLDPRLRLWLFTGANGVVLMWVGLWLSRHWRQPTAGVLGLVLIFAGGLSNLLDRLVHDGRVVDFLNVGVGDLRTGIFNVADLAIVFGVAVIILRRPLPRPKSSQRHTA